MNTKNLGLTPNRWTIASLARDIAWYKIPGAFATQWYKEDIYKSVWYAKKAEAVYTWLLFAILICLIGILVTTGLAFVNFSSTPFKEWRSTHGSLMFVFLAVAAPFIGGAFLLNHKFFRKKDGHYTNAMEFLEAMNLLNAGNNIDSTGKLMTEDVWSNWASGIGTHHREQVLRDSRTARGKLAEFAKKMPQATGEQRVARATLIGAAYILEAQWSDAPKSAST